LLSEIGAAAGLLGLHARMFHIIYRVSTGDYLEVEMTDPDTGISTRIRSQGYRRPVHRYLGSDRVTVYTDRSGWKHYLEDFQWKEHKNDPDIFDYPREFEEVHLESGRLSQIIFVVILLLMILNVFIQR